MTKKTLYAGLGIAVIVTGGFFGLQIPYKKKYDERMERLSAATQLVAHPMDNEARSFLETVRGSWSVRYREQSATAFSKISSLTGIRNSVDGMIEFYTHETPPYSFFDLEQNKRESKIAEAMVIALPTSIDGRVYHGEGICFIKLNENLVEVFEDGEQGLSRTLYTEIKSGEQDGAG